MQHDPKLLLKMLREGDDQFDEKVNRAGAWVLLLGILLLLSVL